MNVPAISSPSVSPALTAASVPHRLAHQPMSPSALRRAPEDVQRAEVAAQFEAILLRQLLAPTMNSMLGGEATGGASASVYGDIMTDTFAQQLSRGGGLGLAGLLVKQLTPRTPHAPSADSVSAATH